MAYSKHTVEKRLSIWEYAAEQREVAKRLLAECKKREKQLQKVKSS
jgi:hypothetical protein